MIARRDLKSRLFIVAALLATMSSISLYPRLAASHDSPQVHTVIISDFKFTPSILQVKPGDKIIWVNQDIVPHTATAIDKSWDTGIIVSQGRKEMAVTKIQTLSYYCFYHPVMTAKLVLEKGVKGDGGNGTALRVKSLQTNSIAIRDGGFES